MRYKKILITTVITTLSILIFAFFSVIGLGVYKFNYLSGQPGYSVDGNKCFKINPKIGCDRVYSPENKIY